MILITSVSQDFTVSAYTVDFDLSAGYLTSAVKAIVAIFVFFVIYLTIIICL